MSSASWCWCGEATGHVLNDRPWRITRGDLFYIRAEDKHSYASVNDLVLQNIIYCRSGCSSILTGPGRSLASSARRGSPTGAWAALGMAQARQVISQLEHECARRDAQGNAMAELLFAQLALTLQRHRYATDDPAATQREALLDKLLAALAASLSRPFVLERFCEQEGGSERALRQQFRQQTGMTINHYLRQLRICHAQYLLQHTERLIGDIAMQCGFEDSNYFSVVLAGKSACRRAVAAAQSRRRLKSVVVQADDPVINWPFPDRRYWRR